LIKSSSSSMQIAKRLLFALVIGLAFGGIFILVESAQAPVFPWAAVRQAFVLLLLYIACMVAFTTLAFGLINRLHPAPALTPRLVVLAFAGFLISAVLSTWIGGHLIRFIYPGMDVLNIRQYLMVSLFTLTFGIPVFLYMAVRELWKNALEKVREKEVAQERLEKELLAARLQTLQAQTNPHFLFNTLNSIATLISTDPARAETTVERLAALFRYALDRHDGKKVFLAEEMRIVKDYLDIEKTRFGDRLKYQIFADPAVLRARVPPLLLQPLVENAVKHGVSKREEETCVEVLAEVGPTGLLRVRVRNQGPPPVPEQLRNGVGLANIRSRCRAMYGDCFGLSLRPAQAGWTEAELEIPLEDEK
jgi:two-component system, LytTR family, sensor histidine kinase AlgZ